MINYTEQHIYEDRKLTIEEQLHYYEQHPEKSERNAVLWHAWQQNKQWLTQLLELTITSFPAYSRHNASHAKAILYNIERILGEDRIRKLEPTDCFALLHVVYVHDIGMAILADDREEMVTSDEFAEMVDELSVGVDYDLKKAANELKRVCYQYRNLENPTDMGGEEYLNSQKSLYRDKFNVYYAIIQMMAEFQRGKHGEKAASKISSWIMDQDKLRSEFAMSGIPLRIFLHIADCASLHTEWDFQHVLDLPFEDDGYERDMLHPRFIAVLLQLGDALDIDNDRFHPFAQAFLGRLPMQSQAHYDKHMAIRTFKITPEEILVEADCPSREALRLVRQECDNLERLLESSSYHWLSIAPRNLGGALPTLKSPRLLLNGKEIPTDLAMMRFNISQRKAFSLLQGENICSGRFPFVREVLQNAIDSTKIQCWSDYISSSKFRYKEPDQLTPSILDVAQIVNLVEYPIEIEIKCGKQTEESEWKEVDFNDIGTVDEEEAKDEQYGILFSIRDYGTGIGTEVLRDIAEVGTSYKKRKKKIRAMPEWLRPIGEFGIGLQSVFLVSDNFYCETYTRSGDRYKIEFRTGATGENGYINVEPKKPETDKMSFGSEFEIFISHKKKIERDEFIEAWQGYDPFDADYEKDTIRRDIVELTSQLLLDIDSQLGEMLFPIYVHVGYPFESFYKSSLLKKINKITIDMSPEFRKHTEEELKKHVSWIYQPDGQKNKEFQCFEMNGGRCAFDFKNMKLYIWLTNISTCARLGVDRILCPDGANKKLCRIYFKGIKAEETMISGDDELLEMIDIKGGKMENNVLQLNRSGFTSKGEEHIARVIVPEIMNGVREALGIIAREAKEDSTAGEEQFEELAAKYIEEEIKRDLENTDSTDAVWPGQMLAFSLFYHFYMMYAQKNKKGFKSQKISKEIENWDRALKKVESVLEKKRQSIKLNKKTHVGMDLPVSVVTISGTNDYIRNESKKISVADFYDQSNHFLVVSKRHESGAEWMNYLVQLAENNEMDVFDKIKSPADTDQEIKEQQQWLEEWGQFMLENVEGLISESSVEQNRFLQKQLQYVPVIGRFSDKTGNKCIHVMNGEPLEYIYYNNHAKYQQMLRMVERYKATKAERFAIFPPKGSEMLKVTKCPKDTCGIQENYVFDGGNRMLYPCSGTGLKELLSDYEKTDASDRTRECGEELQRIFSFQFDYYVNDDPEIYNKFEQARNAYTKEMHRPTGPDQFRLLIKLGYNRLIRIRREMIPLNIGTASDLKEPQQIVQLARELYKNVFDAWGYVSRGGIITSAEEAENTEGKEKEEKCMESIDKLLVQQYCWEQEYHQEIRTNITDCVNKVKDKYWDNSKEKELMFDWVVQNSQIDRDIVKERYEKIWTDMINVLISRKGIDN